MLLKEESQVEMHKFLIDKAIQLIQLGIFKTDEHQVTRKRELTVADIAELHLELKRELSLFML